MTDRSVTKTSRHRRPKARPGEILAAALELFSERGFSATRMEDISDRAGISKAAIYLYFKDKLTLLQTLVQETVTINLTKAREMAEHHAGPVSPLISSIVEFMAGRVETSPMPDILKLVIAESRSHPEIGRYYLENVVNQGVHFLEGLVQRGIQSGEFRKVDPALTVRTLFAPMLVASIWKTVFQPLGAEPLDIQIFLQLSNDVLLRGLKP
ncbi:TetR family transcriptional regulator [Aestuariivirga sp.]|uniref:TetR family transcriptional regulator n=1 Tax=Aestuariivirga sp. TaxID=2650926 RepID=UPI0039E53C10